MALVETTLATELEALVPTVAIGVGAARLATAYGHYMHDATAGGVPMSASAVDATAVPAMADALAFVPGASAADGAAVLCAGVVAFWAAMAASPGSFFSGATAITPPTFATLPRALAAVFEACAVPGVPLSHAAAAIAGQLHAATAGLGTATRPGPVVAPIA